MEKQVKALEDQQVWNLVQKTPGMDVLPGKWVYDEKFNLLTQRYEARARWVACGNKEQEYSWNIEDVYAAVANSTSLRIFLVYMAVHNLDCQQFDFNTAFLNAPIPEGKRYYVEQPTGLAKSDKVCLLRRALYGLRRSPLYWFNTLNPILKTLGFSPIVTDACLYINKTKGALIILYVDDLLIAAQRDRDIEDIAKQLQSRFRLKSMGEVRTFLGYDIVRNRKEHTVFVSQQRYVQAIIKKFDYDGLKGTNTPWPPDYKIYGGASQAIEMPEIQKPYIKKTGSLNYASMGSRPDITFTVNKLCEGNAKPTDRHDYVMRHLFRYLVDHSDLGLLLGGISLPRQPGSPVDLNFRTYADASYADDIETRHSTAGHIVFVTTGPVFWKSKKQAFVTLSTTEAEYTNLVPAARSGDWVAQMLEELGMAQPQRILFTDSANARATALRTPGRNRCIDIRLKWVTEQIEQRRFEVIHIPGTDMVADGLTKGLKADKHGKFVKMLGLTRREIPWLNTKKES
jgi:hypothetical protein